MEDLGFDDLDFVEMIKTVEREFKFQNSSLRI